MKVHFKLKSTERTVGEGVQLSERDLKGKFLMLEMPVRVISEY